jgi:hypothetical protein
MTTTTIEMMVDAVCKAAGVSGNDEEAREEIRRALRQEGEAEDNRVRGSASRVGMKAALAADRRLRIERKQRQAFDKHFPEAKRLAPRNALEVGISPHADPNATSASGEGGMYDLITAFPEAARLLNR